MSSNDGRSRVSGWDEHGIDELDRALMTTPAQRLRWLEEAIAFAFRVGALPGRGEPPYRLTAPRGDLLDALPPADGITKRLSEALEREREERL